MKKAGILVVCFLLTVFTGCSRSKKATWESGVHYEVSNVGSVEKKEFQYRVYDQQHNTIDSGCTDDIEPIFYENDGFLRLSLNYGSGACCLTDLHRMAFLSPIYHRKIIRLRWLSKTRLIRQFFTRHLLRNFR